jgi:hypothetical protein
MEEPDQSIHSSKHSEQGNNSVDCNVSVQAAAAALASLPPPVNPPSSSSTPSRIEALEILLASTREELLDLRQQVNGTRTGLQRSFDGPSPALANGLSHLRKEIDVRQKDMDQRVDLLGEEVCVTKLNL